MALSGTLQNFVCDVMILLFKPYKSGDVIEAHGYTSSVIEIQIFITLLTIAVNKTVLISNDPLATGPLINHSTQATSRGDWTFGIAYGNDLNRVTGC